MKYNFDTIIDRRNTSSIKWDTLDDVFGKDDILPMWVADMDFAAPEPVIEAVRKRAEHGVYGYTERPDSLYDAVSEWVLKRHGWNIKKQWMTFSPGVVTAINTAVLAYTKPGDGVLIQTPVYPPFHAAAQKNKRRLVTNPLKLENGQYTMDFDDLEKKLDDNVKLMVLCSPHNPVGRVWKRDELEKLKDICIKKDIVIVSDEIHSDIVYKNSNHIPFASISDELKSRIVTCIAPSKTFNVAGLSSSAVIIPDDNLRQKFDEVVLRIAIDLGNIFGITAMEAAYRYGEEWLEQLLNYLEGNAAYLVDYIKTNIPEIKVQRPEGTYLAWLDCTGLNMNQEELMKFMTEKAAVGLNNGMDYGEEGCGFMRLNFGCPRSLLEEGLKRIEKAVKTYKKQG